MNDMLHVCDCAALTASARDVKHRAAHAIRFDGQGSKKKKRLISRSPIMANQSKNWLVLLNFSFVFCMHTFSHVITNLELLYRLPSKNLSYACYNMAKTAFWHLAYQKSII